MNSILITTLLSLYLLSVSVACAQENIPKGIIVSKNALKQSVTIRNQATGKRHTYFLNEKTRVIGDGAIVGFDEIRSGQAVALDFVRTDFGRVLNLLRVPSLDQILDTEFTDSDETFYISGVVTGVRTTKRTITIHGPRIGQRLTLHVPQSIVISYNNSPVRLRSINKGDEVEFEYRDTVQGYLIVAGELTKKVTQKQVTN